MKFFYDFIFLLFFVVSIPKAIKRRRLNPEYKGMLARRLFSPQVSWKDGYPKIWLNGVSVGEVISLGPLVKALENEYPGIRLLISATTGTGYHRILKLYPNHQAMGLPFDFSFCVESRLKKCKPDVIVFAELDLWPNFLSTCGRLNLPFVVVGGRISESSARGYAKIKSLLAEPLASISLFLAQDQIDAQRAVDMGIDAAKVEVGGNLKFDLLKTEAVPVPEALCSLKVLKDGGQKFMVLASSHHPEETWFLETMKSELEKRSDWSLILVPRHPERAKDIEKTCEKLEMSCLRFSALVNGETLKFHQVLLIDQIGVLFHLYALADVSFIGGSLIPHGGQNMIEPAALGCPVVFGPHTQNFREAVEILLSQKGAKQVKNLEEMKKELCRLFDSFESRQNMARCAKDAVIQRQGVAKANLEKIKAFLDH